MLFYSGMLVQKSIFTFVDVESRKSHLIRLHLNPNITSILMDTLIFFIINPSAGMPEQTIPRSGLNYWRVSCSIYEQQIRKRKSITYIIIARCPIFNQKTVIFYSICQDNQLYSCIEMIRTYTCIYLVCTCSYMIIS